MDDHPRSSLLMFRIFCSPTYNITVTQIVVGNSSTDLELTAIFDSGTSFTYLNDPAYTFITETVSPISKTLFYSGLTVSLIEVRMFLSYFSLIRR